jgi:hypothetical protein
LALRRAINQLTIGPQESNKSVNYLSNVEQSLKNNSKKSNQPLVYTIQESNQNVNRKESNQPVNHWAKGEQSII